MFCGFGSAIHLVATPGIGETSSSVFVRLAGVALLCAPLVGCFGCAYHGVSHRVLLAGRGLGIIDRESEEEPGALRGTATRCETF